MSYQEVARWQQLRMHPYHNGEPAVHVHHGVVRRWRCGSLVTQRPYYYCKWHCYCLWRNIVIVYDVSISKPIGKNDQQTKYRHLVDFGSLNERYVTAMFIAMDCFVLWILNGQGQNCHLVTSRSLNQKHFELILHERVMTLTYDVDARCDVTYAIAVTNSDATMLALPGRVSKNVTTNRRHNSISSE